MGIDDDLGDVDVLVLSKDLIVTDIQRLASLRGYSIDDITSALESVQAEIHGHLESLADSKQGEG